MNLMDVVGGVLGIVVAMFTWCVSVAVLFAGGPYWGGAGSMAAVLFFSTSAWFCGALAYSEATQRNYVSAIWIMAFAPILGAFIVVFSMLLGAIDESLRTDSVLSVVNVFSALVSVGMVVSGTKMMMKGDGSEVADCSHD